MCTYGPDIRFKYQMRLVSLAELWPPNSRPPDVKSMNIFYYMSKGTFRLQSGNPKREVVLCFPAGSNINKEDFKVEEGSR